MDTNILDDLQLLGLDESVSVQELKRQWRHLSSHTHPDRYRKDTPEFEAALFRQKRLNNAKDRILAFIKERDIRQPNQSVNESQDRVDSTHVEEEEFPREENNTQTTQDTQEKTVSQTMEAAPCQNQHHLCEELFSAGIFFGTMFVGVVAAALVSLMLPFLATTAPIVLVVVMLTTMAGAFVKVKDWSEKHSDTVARITGG